jgi:hypothetical protein
MTTTSASGKFRKGSPFRSGRYRPISRTVWLLAFGIVLVLIIAAAVALMLLPPGWYRPIHTMNDAVYNQADHAQASLMALRNQLRNPHAGKITWTITQREVNSLLAVAYGVPAKTKSVHHPGGFTDPFVRFTDNQITFAARDRGVPGNAVASVGVRIELSRNGHSIPQAHITIDSLKIGNFPLPPSLLTSRLKTVLPRLSPVVRKIIDVYAGPRYANVAAPQIVHSVAAIFSGKSFPTELRLNHRRLVVDQLIIHGAELDASGRRQPAAMTFELVPEQTH